MQNMRIDRKIILFIMIIVSTSVSAQIDSIDYKATTNYFEKYLSLPPYKRIDFYKSLFIKDTILIKSNYKNKRVSCIGADLNVLFNNSFKWNILDGGFHNASYLSAKNINKFIDNINIIKKNYSGIRMFKSPKKFINYDTQEVKLSPIIQIFPHLYYYLSNNISNRILFIEKNYQRLEIQELILMKLDLDTLLGVTSPDINIKKYPINDNLRIWRNEIIKKKNAEQTMPNK